MATEVAGYGMYEVYNTGTLGKLPSGNRRFLAKRQVSGQWHVLCFLTFQHCTVTGAVWDRLSPKRVEFTTERLRESMQPRMKGRNRMAPQFRTIYFSL